MTTPSPSIEELASLSRRDLQKWAKKLGIRANQKSDQLRQAIGSQIAEEAKGSTENANGSASNDAVAMEDDEPPQVKVTKPEIPNATCTGTGTTNDVNSTKPTLTNGLETDVVNSVSEEKKTTTNEPCDADAPGNSKIGGLSNASDNASENGGSDIAATSGSTPMTDDGAPATVAVAAAQSDEKSSVPNTVSSSSSSLSSLRAEIKARAQARLDAEKAKSTAEASTTKTDCSSLGALVRGSKEFFDSLHAREHSKPSNSIEEYQRQKEARRQRLTSGTPRCAMKATAASSAKKKRRREDANDDERDSKVSKMASLRDIAGAKKRDIFDCCGGGIFIELDIFVEVAIEEASRHSGVRRRCSGKQIVLRPWYCHHTEEEDDDEEGWCRWQHSEEIYEKGDEGGVDCPWRRLGRCCCRCHHSDEAIVIFVSVFVECEEGVRVACSGRGCCCYDDRQTRLERLSKTAPSLALSRQGTQSFGSGSGRRSFTHTTEHCCCCCSQ